MIEVLISLGVNYCVYLFVQLLWSKKLLPGEYARKTAHIFSYAYLASYPLYMDWQQIRIVLILSGLVAVGSRHFGWFKAMFDVERKTWGDVIGVITAIAFTFLEPSHVLFAAALLHVGLADGMAAIIGQKYGKGNGYTILGYKKSVAGTAAFFVTSFLIMAYLAIFGSLGASVPILALVCVPLLTTLTENIAFWGADNALVVLVVYALFKIFQLT